MEVAAENFVLLLYLLPKMDDLLLMMNKDASWLQDLGYVDLWLTGKLEQYRVGLDDESLGVSRTVSDIMKIWCDLLSAKLYLLSCLSYADTRAQEV